MLALVGGFLRNVWTIIGSISSGNGEIPVESTHWLAAVFVHGGRIV